MLYSSRETIQFEYCTENHSLVILLLINSRKGDCQSLHSTLFSALFIVHIHCWPQLMNLSYSGRQLYLIIIRSLRLLKSWSEAIFTLQQQRTEPSSQQMPSSLIRKPKAYYLKFFFGCKLLDFNDRNLISDSLPPPPTRKNLLCYNFVKVNKCKQEDISQSHQLQLILTRNLTTSTSTYKNQTPLHKI